MSEDILEALNACIIIPTYNNAATLKRVIDASLQLTNHILVINDGSTDSTTSILAEYALKDKIRLFTFDQNRGKGSALKLGFKKALQIGYRYAITIDSDGQHFPQDIPVFIDEISKNGPALLIGSRNMKHETVPTKSSFGNRFSNFWFWFETGIKLTDTQCGFRLYPLNEISKIRFYTGKFEFEIEVPVKAAWRSIPVRNVPVNVLYDPTERVSHFRPFWDFARISVLNTWLVSVAILYIKPRNFVRSLLAK